MNDIIKALECCTNEGVALCGECPYEDDCDRFELTMMKDVISLINRQKAEIEVMNKAYKIITVDLKSANLEIEMLEALSEQLGDDVDVKLKYIYELEEKLETAKAEAIREFAKRLKEDFMEYKCGATLGYIDYLVEEMTGERE